VFCEMVSGEVVSGEIVHTTDDWQLPTLQLPLATDRLTADYLFTTHHSPLTTHHLTTQSRSSAAIRLIASRMLSTELA
jgi:hypothetical protein